MKKPNYFRWTDTVRVIRAVAPDFPPTLEQFIGFLDCAVWYATGALEIMYNEWFLQKYIKRRQIDRFAHDKLMGSAAILVWCAKWKTWEGNKQNLLSAIADFLEAVAPGLSILLSVNQITVTAGDFSKPIPPKPVTNSADQPFFDISVPGYRQKGA